MDVPEEVNKLLGISTKEYSETDGILHGTKKYNNEVVVFCEPPRYSKGFFQFDTLACIL